MEIVIRTDGDQASAVDASATQQPAAGQSPSQQGGEAMGPPLDLAARAEAIGAIDAGPAQIPTGETGQPLANVASTTSQEMSGDEPDSGTAAGAAPGYAQEATPVVVQEGIEQDSAEQG